LGGVDECLPVIGYGTKGDAEIVIGSRTVLNMHVSDHQQVKYPFFTASAAFSIPKSTPAITVSCKVSEADGLLMKNLVDAKTLLNRGPPTMPRPVPRKAKSQSIDSSAS
jgi:hypothetical protein